MNIALFILLSARRAAQAIGRSFQQHESRDVESYLSKSKSLAELESRQRDWLQSH